LEEMTTTEIQTARSTKTMIPKGAIPMACDGACNGERRGGWAFFDGEHYYNGTIKGQATNNIAEYTSLLKLLDHLCKKNFTGKAVIMMDSQLVAFQINGSYRVKDEKLKPLFLRATALLSALDAEIRWVPRTDPIMARVDQMAKEATFECSLILPQS
jgi:ribonuclease HI